jgi:hypothetical protein
MYRVKDDEMGGACSMKGESKKKTLWVENRMERDQ